jgi:hypothetical protein
MENMSQHNEQAHTTREGYCCACSYDIAGFESRIEGLTAEIEKRYIPLIATLIKKAGGSVAMTPHDVMNANDLAFQVHDDPQSMNRIYTLLQTNQKEL